MDYAAVCTGRLQQGRLAQIECFMQQIKNLQAQCGCDSNLGLKMSVAIEILIVELGVSVQPFQE